MKSKYGAIVIGGGLLGCATAYQLAKRKAGRILLLDGNDIASQASSRAACLLTRARTKPGLMEIVQETYDCIDEIESFTGTSLGLQVCGSVTMASSETSLKGLEAFEDAATRFGLPNERIGRDKLKELYRTKDYGPYALPDGDMPVCFIVNTDQTGGNSGSPVFNARGELIGTGFDRNYEGLTGDIAFHPTLQRALCVDIRYTLFIIDKFAGARHIIDELDIIK